MADERDIDDIDILDLLDEEYGTEGEEEVIKAEVPDLKELIEEEVKNRIPNAESVEVKGDDSSSVEEEVVKNPDIVDMEEVVSDETVVEEVKTIESEFGVVEDKTGNTSAVGNGLFENVTSDGSGDVVQDLINWLNNNDKLPSDPLTSFMSNYSNKAEFALYFTLLNNMTRMKTAMDFVKQSEIVLYDVDNIVSMSAETLENRYVLACKVVDNLIEQNRKVVYNLKKDNKEQETDKLKLLLGALPSEKLKDIIKELR